MKRQAPFLTINKPCHENWDAMTPTEKGRHCKACSKTVIDFTVMGDEAIVHTMAQAKGNVCGRFYTDQLNRQLVVIPQPKPAPFFYRMMASVLLMLGIGSANAQTGKTTTEIVATGEDKELITEKVTVGEVAGRQTGDNIISGRLLEYRDKGVAGSIGIENKFVVETDSAGNFSMQIPQKLLRKKMKFLVSSPGFRNYSFTILLSELPLHKEIYLLKRVAVCNYRGQMMGVIINNE